MRLSAFTGRDRELAGLARALAAPPALVLVEGEAGIGKTRLLQVPAASPLSRLSSRLPPGATRLRLDLGPLDVAGIAGLAGSMLNGQRVSAEFAAFLHQRTGGVPLAAEEAMLLLADTGDLSRRGQGWARRRLERITVPDTIRDAVTERAERLSQDARAVLSAAAVLASPSDEATLRAVAGLPVGRARAGLAEALGSRLLAVDQPNEQGLASFRHVLACRAVYEAVPELERRALHLRAGRALRSASPPPVARLARHFREAGKTAEWHRYAELAADTALAAGDEVTAGVLLHDLVTRAVLPAREMAELVSKMALLAFAVEDQLRDLAHAVRTAVGRGHLTPGAEAELRFQLGRVLKAMGEEQAGRAELERAIPGLPRGSVRAARAMTLLGGWPREATRPVLAHRRWLDRAAMVAGSLEPAERLRLAVDRATALLLLGEEAGWRAADEIPDGEPTAHNNLQVTRGQGNIAEMAVLWGRYDEARRRLVRALDAAGRHQYTIPRGEALVTAAHLDWATGAWDGLAGRAAGLADDLDLPAQTRVRALVVAGLLHGARGDRDQAAGRLGEALTLAARCGAMDYLPEPAAALALLRLDDGAVTEALKVTEEPAAIVARKGTWIWAAALAPARVSALAAARRVGEAGELVTAFARGLRGRDAPAPKAGLALSRAMLAEARGEHLRAAELFAGAAAAWQALPRPYDALLARERQARCLLAAGRQEAAGLALLAEAERELSGLGAAGDADRVARVLRARGLAVPRIWRGGPRGYGNELSPRELDVVRLVLTGRTNREIAEALCRSRPTVATQLTSAMRKLGVSSRAALAVSAITAGITPDGQPRRQGE
jgi:DNA-binding CsgD family transcriptional regulator/tetratricopeptide (TPR) repeat protein